MSTPLTPELLDEMGLGTARVPRVPYVLAIDPGPESSAFVRWDGGTVLASGHHANELILDEIRLIDVECAVAVERVSSYGALRAAAVLLDTAMWAGRFYELARALPRPVGFITFPDVRRHLTGLGNGKEVDVRQALIDRFGEPRGRKCPACKGRGKAGLGRARGPCAVCAGSGWERAPSVTARVTGHEWSALAVAVTWWDRFHTINGGA